MNVTRTAVVLPVLILGLFVATTDAFAAKGGMGGKPPPPDPTGCTDTFPGFAYLQEGTRKAPPEIYLASSDGCKIRSLAKVPDMRGWLRMHMTADGSEGVILFSAEPNDANTYFVRRLDFTVDNYGELSNIKITDLLPLPEEQLSGDSFFYFINDVWGDADHSSLYLAVKRHRELSGGETSTELLIYNLNDPTLVDVHEIHPAAQNEWSWNCPVVDYPQFVPTCYGSDEVHFNPSGTRLYIHDSVVDGQNQRWDGAVRIDIDMGDGLPISEWDIFPPKLIYTGPDGAIGIAARPDVDSSVLPSPEIIGLDYLDRSGNQTVRAGVFLNADLCAERYADLSHGGWFAPDDLWKTDCVPEEPFLNARRGYSWQTPEALLYAVNGKRNKEVYRVYVTDELSGNPPQLLIENGRMPDTGF